MRTKDLKSSKGITLIALVVTIIVLLILAGISIAALTGDNGILTNAQQTSTQNAYKGAEEQVKIAYMAVKTEIMAQTTKNGTYNPASQENTRKLANIVRKDLGLAEGATNSNGTWKVDDTTDGVIKIEYKDSKIDKEVIGTTSLTQLNGTTVQIAVPREEGYVHYQINLLENQQDAKLFVDTADGGGDDSGVTYAANSVHTLAQAGTIKRWDKVNYNPGNATTASISLPTGASLDGTISASDAKDWVVLDVNETTGEVLIMAQTVSNVELRLEGKDGYNNGVDALDMVASINKNDTYAQSARSLRTEDLKKVIGSEKFFSYGEDSVSWNHRYGMDSTSLEIVDSGSDDLCPRREYITSCELLSHDYVLLDLFENYDYYWFATMSPNCWESYVEFSLVGWGAGHLGAQGLFCVRASGSSDDYEQPRRVLPVVSLSPSVLLERESIFFSGTEVATRGTTIMESEDSYFEYSHNEWNLSPASN